MGELYRRCARIWLCLVTAAASNLMISAATALNRLGAVMVGASGQRIMITLGLSAGWTKTISIVSPDWLMAPVARGVVGCWGKADSYSV